MEEPLRQELEEPPEELWQQLAQPLKNDCCRFLESEMWYQDGFGR